MESDRYQNSKKIGRSAYPKTQSNPSQINLSHDRPRQYSSVPHNVNIKIPNSAETSHLATVDLRHIPTPLRKAEAPKNINQSKGQTKLEYTEIFWEQINFLLREQGFSSMNLVYKDNNATPDYSSLAETVINLLNHIILQSTGNSLAAQSQDIQNFQENITNLHKQLEESKSSYKSLNEKLKKSQLKSAKRKEKVKELNKKLYHSKDLTEMLDLLHSDVKDKPNEIFRQIMHRNYDPDYENDLQIMSIILMYEHTRIDNEHELEKLKISERPSQKASYVNGAESPVSHLQIILDKLNVSSPLQALDAIDKMQQVILIVPSIERFISSVYKEIFSHESPINTDVHMEQILPTINNMKARLASLEKLRRAICESYDLETSAPDEIIIEKSESLRHFNRLFKNSGNETKTMEEVFIFVHEMKKFLQLVRESLDLGDDIPVNLVLERTFSILRSGAI